MSFLWPPKRPPQGSAGGSLFTLGRAMTSGQSMMSSFCQRGRNTLSPWPIQPCHRSGIGFYRLYIMCCTLWMLLDEGTCFFLHVSATSTECPLPQNITITCLLSLQNFYEKPAFDYPLNQMSVWLMLGNEGMERESNDSFCAPTPSAMVFGRSDGDRVAVTRDLALRHGYTLQFKVPA